MGEAGNGAVIVAVCAGGDVDDCEGMVGESIVPEDHCHRPLPELFIAVSKLSQIKRVENSDVDTQKQFETISMTYIHSGREYEIHNLQLVMTLQH